jgi:hypothetical protein
MSNSPIVSDQLHTHKAVAPSTGEVNDPSRVLVPVAEPKVWSSVDLPSLNLSDPIGTTVSLPLVPKAAPEPSLKKPVVEPTPKATPMAQSQPLDSGLEARMAQLRVTSTAFRRDADAVRRTTGTLK